MPNLMQQFMEDSVETPNNEELLEISKLANLQTKLSKELTLLEEQLSVKTEELRQVQESLLPDAMAAVGMSRFTTLDGYSVVIKDDIYASIRKDYTEQAIEWLNCNGLGDIVKDEVKINMGRGEAKQAKLLLDLAKKLNLSASEKLTVHPQTLKATIKEQLARGVEFPDEFFSVAPVRKAVIK